MSEPAAAPGPQPVLESSRRRPLFTALAVVVLIAGVGYVLWDQLVAAKRVETDNAYVAADTAQVTPLTTGQVTELAVTDTQMVTAGQVLFRLGADDQSSALSSAEADFAATRRRYQQTLAQGSALAETAAARTAAIGAAQAAVTLASADLAKARADLSRREGLTATGAVSGEEMAAMRTAAAAAAARLAQARATLAQTQAEASSARSSAAAALALVQGTTVDSAPEVRQAAARLDQARLDVSRGVVRAPVSGVIAKLAIQTGQRVSPGMVTMIIVPVEKLYVAANFKENQLGKVRIGQPARLTSDFYGSDVVFHGKVAGLAGGTGAAFSPIPAQNATGNWIKVVQRLPVRIALDPAELRAHPLRVGLSMAAEIELDGAEPSAGAR